MRKPYIPKLYGRKPFSKEAYGKDWKATSTETIKMGGKRCSDCGSSDRLQVHHIIPLSKGGTNHPFNLIVLCHNCHEKRHRHMRRRK